jgi:hypothetical protein
VGVAGAGDVERDGGGTHMQKSGDLVCDRTGPNASVPGRCSFLFMRPRYFLPIVLNVLPPSSMGVRRLPNWGFKGGRVIFQLLRSLQNPEGVRDGHVFS